MLAGAAAKLAEERLTSGAYGSGLLNMLLFLPESVKSGRKRKRVETG